MNVGMPAPIGPLVWLLRVVSSRAAATAAIGDIFEGLAERNASGQGPPSPALWINLQVIRAIGLDMAAAVPRLLRFGGLILRDATRAIRAAPVHSLFVAGVVAAGIALGTVTFSVVDAVVLKPLPIEHPERVVSIPTKDQDFNPRITPDVYWRLHDDLRSVESIAVRSTMTGEMVTAGGITDEMSVKEGTADIFRVLRLSPAIGRLWTPDDEARGNTDVAVLGYRFWRERFDGDRSVIGRTVSVDKRTYTVIGVLSATSDHPETDLTSTPLWVPRVVPHTSAAGYFGGIVARMRPGVSTAQVADEIQRLIGPPEWRPVVTPLLDGYVTPLKHWMLLALGAAALVVLVACANAANLMLTRSAWRSQEMAIRAALGASRWQLAMTVLTEGLLLSLGATAGALLCAVAGVRVARVAVATALPWTFRVSTIALNDRVLGAAIASAVVTGVLFSLVPAWQTSRAPVATLLKDAEAPTATGRRGWRSLFLTVEVATVVVLLVVSWLFVVSLIRVTRIDLGIDRANLLAVEPRLDFQASVDEVRRRIEGVPGVAEVAVSTRTSLPLIGQAFGGAWNTIPLQRADGTSGADVASSVTVLEYRVSSNYFSAAGLTFRRGGTWPADTAGGPSPVNDVVLDELAARRLFGDEEPVGRQVRTMRPAGVFRVIGTVPHVHARGPEEADDTSSAYFPLQPNPARKWAGLFVRTSRPPEQVLPLLTEALKPVAPRLTEPFVFAADDAVRKITAMRRFIAQIMSIFGLVGILIGAAGVYAVMASFVAQQTRELGVRVALGATPTRLQRDVLVLAGRHLLAGLMLGVPAAWWLSRGFAVLFFQVTPADASVYVTVAALLGAVGVVAAWVPARRAASIDPIISLRR